MDSLHGVLRDQLFNKSAPRTAPAVNFNRSLRYRNVTVGFSVFWTLLLAGFGFWELREISKHNEEKARGDANMSFQKDVLFRHWASKHGGVYVPVTDETQPNPYLENMPERDIVTPSGRRLTLMNPAYMTRQMHELAKDRFGVISHITSLKPIRPGNSPDSWETKALKQFETGAQEVTETTVMDGEPVLRFMRPFITEQSCLKCHGEQGYKVGDVRGGISVTIPLKEYISAGRHRMTEELILYVAIWLVGLGGILVGFLQLNLRRKAHLASIEQLRNSEEKFSTFFHHSPVFTCITALEDGTYIEVNEQAFKTLEYHRSELIGKKSTDIGVYSPQERQRFLEALRLHGKVRDMEIVFKTKSGRRITTLTNSEIINLGGRRYLLSAVIDITERRGVEKALARNDAELSAIYEHAPSMMMIVDKDGFVRRLNRAAAVLAKSIADNNKTAGNTPATLLGCIQSPSAGCNCSFGLSPKDCPLRNAILNTRRTGDSQTKIEVQSLLRLGHPDAPLTLLASTALVQVGDERMVLVCMEDISQQKAAEQRIREQAALLEVTHDAIIVVDLSGIVTFWNQGATKLTGWQAPEATGKPLSDLIVLQSLPSLAEIRQLIHANGSWHGDNVVLLNHRKDTIITRCHGVLMCNNAGKDHAILLSLSDITEAKQTENQLFRAQRLESIGSLAGGVAHDLNNVFGPIMLAIPTLRHIAKDTHAGEIVDLINRSVHRGSDIVRKLLLFGRGADSSAQHADLALSSIANELHHILQETFPKNITFTLRLSENLWPIHGDKTQLYQVLLNLCVNARDALPQGGTLTLSATNTLLDEAFTKLHPGLLPGPHVCIQVSDTGTGIPPEIIDKIFDPFFTTKPVGQGSGLGLSTTLGIVRNHHGFIAVDSQPGSGTIFSIHLPATTSAHLQEQAPDRLETNLGHGENILVVDDEQSILHTARLLLAASGYRVTTASSGHDALKLFNEPQNTYQIVLTDIMMPAMDGLQLAQALRAIKPNQPIVTMSGLRDNRRNIDQLPPPKMRHLFKPFSAEDLLEALRATLAENSR